MLRVREEEDADLLRAEEDAGVTQLYPPLCRRPFVFLIFLVFLILLDFFDFLAFFPPPAGGGIWSAGGNMRDNKRVCSPIASTSRVIAAT